VSTATRESGLNATDVLDVHQAAAVLQVGEKMIRRLCNTNRLRHVTIDGRGTIRTTRAWLQAYLERAAAGPKS
jgi:hypothetical protein